MDKHNQKKKKNPKYDKPKCRVCGGKRGMIRKYGIRLCRRCFKDNALKIGFKKYN
ncbi:30S ribosomal protein S14 [Candidatus Micrarchaeota archaeon]|nr:30S ribosomal protein S14 [Candidatus Micrarchaeota archaeon]MBU1930744.1 30S ribosomal protein S14 [Candidatus Micrarchaeota archaeon]